MDLKQVRAEIETKTRSPASDKFYPITSEWVPVPDVMAILDRYEKHWREFARKLSDAKPDESTRKLAQLVDSFLGSHM